MRAYTAESLAEYSESLFDASAEDPGMPTLKAGPADVRKEGHRGMEGHVRQYQALKNKLWCCYMFDSCTFGLTLQQ